MLLALQMHIERLIARRRACMIQMDGDAALEFRREVKISNRRENDAAVVGDGESLVVGFMALKAGIIIRDVQANRLIELVCSN